MKIFYQTKDGGISIEATRIKEFVATDSKNRNWLEYLDGKWRTWGTSADRQLMVATRVEF